MVGLDHRVDVRRVEQRDAARHAFAGGQHEQPVAAGPGQPLLPDAGQGGQEVVLGEPVDVVWMAGQHRAVGGRAAHAGGAHVRPDDAVHQGRLAGAGRADQGHQHRRGGPADPGQQVVIDLAEQLGAFGLHPGGIGDLEHQGHRGDPFAQVEQSGFEQARVDPDMGLDRRPGRGGLGHDHCLGLGGRGCGGGLGGRRGVCGGRWSGGLGGGRRGIDGGRWSGGLGGGRRGIDGGRWSGGLGGGRWHGGSLGGRGGY